MNYKEESKSHVVLTVSACCADKAAMREGMKQGFKVLIL